MTKLHHEHPGSRLRLNRTVFAVCGVCGAQYDYDERSRLYRRLSPDEEYAVPESAKA